MKTPKTMNALAVTAALFCGAFTLLAASPSMTEVVRIGGAGHVAIVNACKVDPAPLKRAAEKFGDVLMVPFSVQNGEWSLPTAAEHFAAAKANAAIFVVNDQSLPISLVAVEAKWGLVNACSLDATQLEREILRVAAIVLGGATSQYQLSVMRPAFSSADLSDKVGSVVTFDVLMSLSHNLSALGITPYKMMTRGDAIEDGYLKE